MNRLKQKYQEEVVPALKKELALKSDQAVPKITKISVNIGVTDPQDVKARKNAIDNIVEQFKVITGQKPQVALAKKAISTFKLRDGDPVGVAVTLRGDKMWVFLDKLISIALPRVKDFRGVSIKALDGQGNYSLGIEEQIIFPEISYDSIERIRSLQVNIISNTNDDQKAKRVLELLGMPFEKEDHKT